jgi:predicted GNAT family N-acyltransferase
MISVDSIAYSSKGFQKCLVIRRKVFVEEQKVPEEEEVDQFEVDSKHYLAQLNNIPVGAARWRKKGEVIKLERFAVLKEYRSKKIGSALVDKILKDLKREYGDKAVKLLLHSQVSAIGLYKKFGFIEEGELFDECGIMHRTMTRML